MRHIRIPTRERIRNTEVVKVVDNTSRPLDPAAALRFHVSKIKQIIEESGESQFDTKDLASMKRSVEAIEKRVNNDKQVHEQSKKPD